MKIKKEILLLVGKCSQIDREAQRNISWEFGESQWGNWLLSSLDISGSQVGRDGTLSARIIKLLLVHITLCTLFYVPTSLMRMGRWYYYSLPTIKMFTFVSE